MIKFTLQFNFDESLTKRIAEFLSADLTVAADFAELSPRMHHGGCTDMMPLQPADMSEWQEIAEYFQGALWNSSRRASAESLQESIIEEPFGLARVDWREVCEACRDAVNAADEEQEDPHEDARREFETSRGV